MSAEGQELILVLGGPKGLHRLTAVSQTYLHRQAQGDFCCMHFETKAETQVLSLCKAFGYIPGEEGLGLSTAQLALASWSPRLS